MSVGWGGGAIKGRNSNNYTAQFVTVISIFRFAIFLCFQNKMDIIRITFKKSSLLTIFTGYAS